MHKEISFLKVFHVTTQLFFLFGFLHIAQAAGPGGGSTGSISPQAGQFTPPQPQAFQSQAALLSSCGPDDLTNAAANDPFAGVQFGKCNFNRNLRALVQSASDLFQQFGEAIGTGFTEVTHVSCSKPLENISTEPTDCLAYRETVEEGMSRFSSTLYGRALMRLRRQQSVASCKLDNLKSAQELAKCFENEVTRLRQGLDLARREIDGCVQRFKGYVAFLDEEINREEQVINRLEKKQESLNKTIQDVEKALAALGASSAAKKDGEAAAGISSFRQSIKALEDRKQDLELEKRQFLVQGATFCIEQDKGAQNSSFKDCQTPGGGLIASPLNCILEQYERNQRKAYGGTGTKDDDSAIRKKAERDKNLFSNTLKDIFDDLKRKDATFGTSINYTYIQQRLARFGSPVGNIISEFKKCEQEAQRKLDLDLKFGQGSIGKQDRQLTKDTEDLRSTMAAVCEAADRPIRAAGSELFNEQLGARFNPGGCQATASQSEAGVEFKFQDTKSLATKLEQMQGLMRAMLLGTPPPGARVPLNISLGIPGAEGVTVTCQGLYSCSQHASNLRAKHEERKNNLEKGEFPSATGEKLPGKQKFKNISNRAIEEKMNKAADAFRGRMQALASQLGVVKGALNEEGLSDLPSFDAKENKGFTCPQNASPDTVCEVRDFRKTIEEMSGMPDIKPEDFRSINRDSESKRKDITAKQKELNDNLKQLQAIRGKCEEEDEKKAEEAAKAVRRDVSSLQSQVDAALQLCQVTQTAVTTAQIEVNAAVAAALDAQKSAVEQANKPKVTQAEARVKPAGDLCISRLVGIFTELSELCSSKELREKVPVQCRSLQAQIGAIRQQCETICQVVATDRQKEILGEDLGSGSTRARSTR